MSRIMHVRLAILVGGALLSTVVSGCGSNRTTTTPQGSGTDSVATSSTGLTAIPVSATMPAFADRSGGTLAPAASDTTFPLSVEAVQALLAKDGASAQWVTDSPNLVVHSGLYQGLAVASGSGSSTSTAPIAAYVFSQNTGPCPAAGGGAGTPAPGDTQPTTCTGTVVADAATGDIIDVEVGPA